MFGICSSHIPLERGNYSVVKHAGHNTLQSAPWESYEARWRNIEWLSEIHLDG